MLMKKIPHPGYTFRAAHVNIASNSAMTFPLGRTGNE